MASMSKTYFGSHRAWPGFELSICQGRALFPRWGTFRAGISSSGMSRNLFNGRANAGIFKASANLSYAIHHGICGPAWAGAFFLTTTDLAGSSPKIKIENNLSRLGGSDGDAFTGGFFMGTTLYVGANISVEILSGIRVRCRRWSCSISWRYSRIGSFNAGINIDLWALLFELLSAKPKRSDFQGPDVGIPGKGSSIVMVDGGNGLLNDGAASIRPEYSVEINLINYIPVIGKINYAMSRFGTGLGLGPYFAVVFPIRFRITKFGVNQSGTFRSFDVGNRSGSDLPLTSAGGIRNPGTNRAIARIQWNVRVNFEIGIFGSIRVLWVIGFGLRIGFSVGNLIPGFNRNLATYSVDVVSAVGNTDPRYAVLAGASDGECGCETPMLADAAPSFEFASTVEPVAKVT